MKRVLLGLLLVSGAAFAPCHVARAQDDGIQRPSYALLRQSLAARASGLRTSIASESTFVGHSHTDHTAGGANPWNIYVGTARPGVKAANNAIWEFDDQTGLGAGDSLQGWWPDRAPYRYAPISTMTDDQRPWYCVDHGNQGNMRPINGRTNGVTSYWHADPGYSALATGMAREVRWHALAGNRSMWCGLRALNDVTRLDPVTHQPYNEAVVQNNVFAGSTAAGPEYRAYPGYGNSWDQIFFRDFPATNGNSMEIKFLYRTTLSPLFSTGVTTRTGWFHGDPLSMTAGNFISANAAGANAPRDSFSVYIGCPVRDDSCAYTDGRNTPVFDQQRRWFDEVIRFDAPRFEILGQAGNAPADSTLAPISVDQVIPWADRGNGNAYVAAIYNASGNPAHLVRLAFRLKTNRSYSDDDYKSGNGVVNAGYTSYGQGGVQLDNVSVDGTTYDFETTDGGVDNAVDAAGHWLTPASAAWKSTGKPAPTYFHAVNLNNVTWHDVCGPPHSSTSLCDLDGIVVSIGNADQNEAIADPRWASQTEWLGGFISPTVDMVTNPDGVTPNEQGITGHMTQATDDIYIQYELNFASLVLANSGTLWYPGVQVYPALTANGHNTWSDLVYTPFRFYQSYQGCLPDLESYKGNSMLHTSNASGIPDSLRLYLGITSECFYFGGTCNNADGSYFDDISLVFANKTSADPLGPIASDMWQFFNDAFPVNGYLADNVLPGSTAFDTTTAMVKGALNNAASTGDVLRPDVLADSITVSAPNGAGVGANMRVDLVFRILPGPGNYQASAGRTFPPTSGMQLLRVPTDQSQVVSPGDGSFWGEYMANPGQFASPGAHAGGLWDHLAWNSARCDTIETNVFPVAGKASSGVDPSGNTYQSTYHESDPHYERLGILKGRCFMIDPALSAYSPNISCDTTFTKVPGNLVGNYELAATSGFDGRFSTREYTKIIPDGLLTPGSHVEYFFRKQRADGTGSYAMDPDTTTIAPQLTESNFDGHRWQEFSVLPDRWKATEFGGAGMACMLYVDNDDRRGDELTWVSVMDSIGGTAPAKWGAHNGWHAAGAGFGLSAPGNPGIAAAYVNKNQQPGTVWDMYGVKASESGQTGGAHIGNRYAQQPGGLMTGKGATIGPRKDWLRTFYRMVTWQTGDGSTNSFGPVVNIGSDDVGLMEDFLATSTGTTQPRTLFVQGDGFAEQCVNDGGPELTFLTNYLFAGLRDASYTHLTPALAGCPDLVSSPAIVPDGTIFAVLNACDTHNDVLTPAGAEASVASNYQAIGPNAPYVASVEHTPTAGHNWHTLLDGWDLSNTFSRYCATSNGRLAYVYDLMTNAFGSTCGAWSYTATLDVPNNAHGGPFVNFMKLGNSVLRSGNASVHFGAEHDGRVRIRLYDVTGRVVRTLTDRTFEAGEHQATWDGRDDGGDAVARGVYFARIEFATGSAINGRVVVLR